MTITGRAQRNTFLGSTSVPSQVGPGSYSIEKASGSGASSTSTRINFVPFSATSKREVMKPTSVAPGPGTYNNPMAIQRNTDTGGTSYKTAFGSTGERLGPVAPGSTSFAASTVVENPGPGTYSLKGLASNAVARNKITNNNAISSVPVQRSVPTIPQKEQSYGYKKLASGALKAQKPPANYYTGVKGDTVGPAFYGSNDNTNPPKSVVSFGKSSTKRQLWERQPSLMSPGPGQYYDNKTASHGVKPEVVKGRRKIVSCTKSSMFASSTPILHQPKRPEQSYEAGPGSYYVPSSFTKKSTATTVKPTFGSAKRQPFGKLNTSTSSTSSSFVERKPNPYKSNNNKSSSLNDESVGFSATSQRDCLASSKTSQEPGPGSYSSAVISIAGATGEKKKVGRHGVFGSTSQRFSWSMTGDNRNEEDNGAITYEDTTPQSVVVATRRKAGSSMFKSTSNRFREKVERNRLEEHVFDEDIGNTATTSTSSNNKMEEDDKKKTKQPVVSGSFGSKSKRIDFGNNSNSITPGPGSYGSVITSTSAILPRTRSLAHRSTIGSQQRFTKVKAVSVKNGPGAYESCTPFLKKSFNVTLQSNSTT